MDGLKGAEIRSKRVRLGLSQAKLARAARVPQRLLSDFELGQVGLNDEYALRLDAVLGDRRRARALASAKKLTRKLSYSPVAHDPARVGRHARTAGNADYLAALGALAPPPQPQLRAVSLFSGAGGFSLGFAAAGFAIAGHLEKDPKLRAIFEANFPASAPLGFDAAALSDAELAALAASVGEVDVVIGGPPCQGFSLTGRRDARDPRNALFRAYLRLVAALRPKAAALENVRLMTSMRSAEGRLVKDEIVSGLRALGYRVRLHEANAQDFGAPQRRERAFFVALREDLAGKPSFPAPTHGPGRLALRSFADACSDLPFLESGEASGDPLHVAVAHPRHVLDWLWDTPQGASAHDNADPAKRPPSGYNTTYKRQVWDEPAATVQTNFGMISGSRNVHPIATRALTFREAARLQGFPDSFRWFGSAGALRSGIGNAVPPLLAQALGRHLAAMLRDA